MITRRNFIKRSAQVAAVAAASPAVARSIPKAPLKGVATELYIDRAPRNPVHTYSDAKILADNTLWIWVDTVNGFPGHELGNGTKCHPVNNCKDAKILADMVGTNCFKVVVGSAITFMEGHKGEVWHGKDWDLDINWQSVLGSVITGARLA